MAARFGAEAVLNMLDSSLNESNLEMDNDSLPETEEPMTEQPDSVTDVDTNCDVDSAQEQSESSVSEVGDLGSEEDTTAESDDGTIHESSEATTPSRTKKRVKRPYLWKRKKMTNRRNSGKTYTSVSGKKVGVCYRSTQNSFL